MLVAPRVRLLRAPNPSPMTGPGTNTYLFGKQEVAVVDPGPDLMEHVDTILAIIEQDGGHLTALLVTHGHRDHLPAAYRLRERTGAPILAHPSIAKIDRPLRDGDGIPLDGYHIRALETPGHASDHLCFWLDIDTEGTRLLFTGDLVVGSGTVVLADAPGVLAEYLASLQRVRALGRTIILPGHGPVVQDGQAKIDEYLEHRASRTRQIVEALRDGPATVEALVERLYRDTRPELRGLAARNIRAHLEWLEAQGHITSRDGIWEAHGLG